MNFYTVTRAYHTTHKVCIKSTIGPPLHFNISFRTFLPDRYPKRLVGGGGRNDWPAMSPDKTSLFFCLWSNFNSIMQVTFMVQRNCNSKYKTNANKSVTHLKY
jgi:hypothetical protein